jgi:hypothetical protein
MMINFREIFDDRGYVVLKNIIDPFDVLRMNRRIHHMRKAGVMNYDPQAPISPALSIDPIMSEMQEKYCPIIVDLLQMNLFPTYTYARLYQPKEELLCHSDRPSCEISFTTTLSYNTFDDQPWDIWVESVPDKKTEPMLSKNGKQGTPYKLYPTDILLYKGCDLEHWREQFVGVEQAQLFVHYVNADGPYKEYKYDCRDSLGSSYSTRDNKKFQKLNQKYEIPLNKRKKTNYL